jgi:hypothetical protein
VFGAARKVNHPARKVFCLAGRALVPASLVLVGEPKVGMVAGKALRMGGHLCCVEGHFDLGSGVGLLDSGVCVRLIAEVHQRLLGRTSLLDN